MYRTGENIRVRISKNATNLVSEIESGMFCRNYLYDSGKTEQ